MFCSLFFGLFIIIIYLCITQNYNKLKTVKRKSKNNDLE